MRRVTTFNQLSDFQRKFESKARFLIDESVGMEAARLIRDGRWNVCYVDDVGLSQRSDEEVFAFAWKEQRILLTYDFDFLDDSRFPFNRNPGLARLKPVRSRALMSILKPVGSSHSDTRQ